MSAMAGIVYWDGRSAGLSEASRLMKNMAEEFQSWQEGPAAFASGHSLFENRLNSTVTVFYGRLDGMIPELPPAEAVSKAFARGGHESFRGMTGDFTAAVWDKDKRRLILARDPLGIKPLYYVSGPPRFLFSSEIRSFAAFPDIQLKPDDGMVVQYLAGEFFDPGATFYAGIRQVPPAHYLIVEAGRAPRLQRYWNFRGQDLSRFKDRRDYLDAFHSLFKEAVRCRLQGSGPAGVLLSGGLDSTQITAMAETLRLENPSLPPVHNACLLVEGFLEEEKISIDRLAGRYGSSIEFVRHGTEDEPLSTFELFMETGDTPHLDGYLTTPLLLERLRQKGCRTVLSGFGANEIINPFEFGYLEDRLLSLRWKQLRFEIERFAAAVHCRPWDLFQSVLSQAAIDCAPDFVRAGLRLLRRSKSKWLKDNYKKLWSLRPAPRPKTFSDLARQKSWRSLTEPLAGFGLAQMDQTARAFGMEARFPFLDTRLVEFFLSVPAEIKMEGGYRKNFAQSALASVVPMPVRTEDDDRCFIPALTLRERIELETARLKHYFAPAEAPLFRYVDRAAVKTLIEEARKNGRINLPFLWRLARLNAWLGRDIFWMTSPGHPVILNSVFPNHNEERPL